MTCQRLVSSTCTRILNIASAGSSEEEDEEEEVEKEPSEEEDSESESPFPEEDDLGDAATWRALTQALDILSCSTWKPRDIFAMRGCHLIQVVLMKRTYFLEARRHCLYSSALSTL
jgi:hypothetical protein